MLGGRDHLSHRLVALGIDEQRAVLGALRAGGARRRHRARRCSTRTSGYAAILIALYLILLGLASRIVLGHVEAHAAEADRGAPPLVSEVAYRNRVYEVLLDVALIALAYYAAFRFRFQAAAVRASSCGYFATSFPLVLACQIAGLALAGKYRQVWRSFGAPELLVIVKGIGIGVAGSVAADARPLPVRAASRGWCSRSTPALLVFLLVGGAARHHLDRRAPAGTGAARGRPVLIYGAGVGGAPAGARAARGPRRSALLPVGFIDDDPAKRRLRLEGVPVLGTFARARRRCSPTREVTEVIVSIRDARPHAARPKPPRSAATAA